jgi:two-component system, OmpR family, sensor histidine kinase KdpD
MTDEAKADTFLRMIRRSERGRLKIYLGYAAGVGKTTQMLLEGRRLKDEGIDVVIGLVETHRRAETERLLAGLEIIPRRRHAYRGIVVEEMDVDALKARKPQVALIDELAHTNIPGGRSDKRYEDVQDVLAAGIHVITTLNIQHLESLNDTVEHEVGIKVRERLPDSVIAEADQIVSVDVSAEDLRQRLKEGKVYTTERIELALERFFRKSNLDKLRELTLRELASQIDFRRRDVVAEEDSAAPDQVMVCLSSRGRGSEQLLRYGSRLAGRLNRNWYAVYVQTPSEEPTAIDVRTLQVVSETLTLAKQLGAIVFTYKGEDIVRTLLQFAKEYRVGHIVIGSPRPRTRWEMIRGKTGIVERILQESSGITVTVLNTKDASSDPVVSRGQAGRGEGPGRTGTEAEDSHFWSKVLGPERIIVWDEPVDKDTVLGRLVETMIGPDVAQDAAELFQAVQERENQGSTFFNEGAAFPHARIEGLDRTHIAVGVTRFGLRDTPTEIPIGIVFLIVSPAQRPDEQIKYLALASRLARNREFRKSLADCRSAEGVLAAIEEWERMEKPKFP